MIDSAEALRALQARAQRHECLLNTPGGARRFVWHRWGGTCNRPVVLVHGGSGSWNHWCRNIEALVADGHEVWAPDLPGFGESDAIPGARDADALVKPFARAVDSLLSGRPFHCLAFSFGAIVAAEVAQGGDTAMCSLGLVGAPGLGLLPTRSFRLQPWKGLPAEQMRSAHAQNLRALMLSSDAAVDELALHIQASNLPRDRLRRRRLTGTDRLARLLPRIPVALHGIWGEDDALYRGVGGQLDGLLAQAQHFCGLRRVRQSGHWVQYQSPRAFNALLREALAVCGN